MQRHQLILDLAQESSPERMLSTRNLAKQLGVSEMTIRRDLQELADDGLIRRQHGGVLPLETVQESRPEIGVLLVSRSQKFTDPFFNAVLEGVDARIHQLGYHIGFIYTYDDIHTADQARDLLTDHRNTGGIVLAGTPRNVESVNYLRQYGPFVVSIAESLGSQHDSILFDGHRGIFSVVEHLFEQGYRNPGFISGFYDEREQGFIDAVRHFGLPDDPSLRQHIAHDGDGWPPQFGEIGAEILMSRNHPPDAIVCASDRIAIGAIQWLHQHNLRVPDDLAVTGFDNITDSEFTNPPLTTVHVHKYRMGELAAERLIRRIENPDEIPLQIRTPTRLLVRRSTRFIDSR